MSIIQLSNKKETSKMIAVKVDADHRLTSTHTKTAYKKDLADFEAWRGERPFTLTLVRLYASELVGVGLLPSTINRKISSIRWWAGTLADMAHEDNTLDPNIRAEVIRQCGRIRKVQGVRGDQKSRVGINIPVAEFKALIEACSGDNPNDFRDLAMFAVMWQTGLRIGELLELDFKDWHVGDDGVATLTVWAGKGNKTHVAYLYGGAVDAVNDWINVRGEVHGVLFCRIIKGGRIMVDAKISKQAAHKLFKKRKQQACINPNITWHDFRRSLIGNLLDGGVDLSTTQKLIGHANPTTTSRYDKRGEIAKQRAASSIHVPYVSRCR